MMSNVSPQALPQGSMAPDFTLPSGENQVITFHNLRGNPAILVFYPADWTPFCDDQLMLYNRMLPVFRQYNASLLGISVDSPWCHRAFTRECRLRFPLLSDFEPKGAVAQAYGVYDAARGVAQRAIFVIDAGGIVYWRSVSPLNSNPGAHGIIEALNALQTPGKTSFHSI